MTTDMGRKEEYTRSFHDSSSLFYGVEALMYHFETGEEFIEKLGFSINLKELY